MHVAVLGVGHTAMNDTHQEFGCITFIPTSTSETINYILPQMRIHRISSFVIITSQVTENCHSY